MAEQAGVADARVRASLEVREPLERQLAPLGRAVIDRLRLDPGERVLDIGCGIGGTPLALAHAVGRGGEVIGADVSEAAIDVASADPSRPPNVGFLRADAGRHAFTPGGFDAAFSRFGVMFFADPTAAFANVMRALRPGGRLGFVCWRRLAENELDALPLRAASAGLPAGLVAEAERSSHFSFADPDFLRETLTRAGFAKVDIRPHDQEVGCGDLQGTVDVCSRFGSLGKILREHPELRREAVPALEKALKRRDGPNGPTLRAATWIVLASAPG